MAVCLGALFGFLVCGILGRVAGQKNIYRHVYRLHPYIESQTSYYPTASQLITIVHAQCRHKDHKTLVIVGGNSVFTGSGQKGVQLWTRILQTELGDSYCVVNLAAAGGGMMDNGGVVFRILAQEYPDALFITNTEPGYYPAFTQGPYNYLFWDAYYKRLVPESAFPVHAFAAAPNTPERRELLLGRRLNSLFYFDDLWNFVAYRYFCTTWNSWLKERSFKPRGSLPDWFDIRPKVVSTDEAFQRLLPGHLDTLRSRRPAAPDRFQQAADGSWAQKKEDLKQDEDAIAELLPTDLAKRSLVVLTPYNPFFLNLLTDDERSRVTVSYHDSAQLLAAHDFHVLSLNDHGFVSTDFGDTVHLAPPGAQRLAQLVATAVREMKPESKIASHP